MIKEFLVMIVFCVFAVFTAYQLAALFMSSWLGLIGALIGAFVAGGATLLICMKLVR